MMKTQSRVTGGLALLAKRVGREVQQMLEAWPTTPFSTLLHGKQRNSSSSSSSHAS